MTKLSIIIPYYNSKKYTDELMDCLGKQINDETEVILVDDGSPVPYESNYKWLTVYRKENGGCATARNYGLERASGEYVQFIDSDDLVPNYFIKRLFKAFDIEPDVIDYSWKSLTQEGIQHDYVIGSESGRLINPSVCTRCFRRSYIGKTRFNELKDSTEDEDFSRKLGFLDENSTHKHYAITDYMYFYRTAISNSKVKRFKKGLMKTKRVVYHYEHVTKDMWWLLDEIKREDEKNEVWLLTNQNDIPELSRYCQICTRRISIWGHEFRGEPYSGYIQIELPIKVDVVMYCEFANFIGGISTFMYYWAHYMKKYYDILILYDAIDERQVEKLNSVVPTMKNDPTRDIVCNTLILNRLTDKIPPNVSYGKTVQMCHACGPLRNYKISKDRDYLVNVSKASKDSWGEESEHGIVIHNPFYEDSNELVLVSATRMQASDKGQNEKRFRKLAEMLNEAKIPFVWLNFSDKPLPDPPKNFINMDARLNIQSFIKRASYLVQLSDREAYSLSILEALCLNTPVLCTPFESLFEEGFVDGQTGYVIPFNMDFDVNKLLNVPRFDFRYDNKSIVKQWKKLLNEPNKGMRYGFNEEPAPDVPVGNKVKVNVIKSFRDKRTGKLIPVGEAYLPKSRVDEILVTQAEKKIKLIEVK